MSKLLKSSWLQIQSCSNWRSQTLFIMEISILEQKDRKLDFRVIQFVFLVCSPRACFFGDCELARNTEKNMKFFSKTFCVNHLKRCFIWLIHLQGFIFFHFWIILTGHWPRWIRMFYTRYSKLTVRFLAWTLCRTDVLFVFFLLYLSLFRSDFCLQFFYKRVLGILTVMSKTTLQIPTIPITFT